MFNFLKRKGNVERYLQTYIIGIKKEDGYTYYHDVAAYDMNFPDYVDLTFPDDSFVTIANVSEVICQPGKWLSPKEVAEWKSDRLEFGYLTPTPAQKYQVDGY